MLSVWLCVGVQVEDEIQTLSQVLAAKERRLADIKKKLGVTPLNEFKQNISRTWQEVTASNAYVPHLLVCAHVRVCDQILQVSMCENLTAASTPVTNGPRRRCPRPA